MGKNKQKLEDMPTDALREYWLSLVGEYRDLIKNMKHEKRELDAALAEARKLLSELRELQR